MTLFYSEGVVALSIIVAGFLYSARQITSVNLINNDGSYVAALLGSSGMAPTVPSSSALNVNQRATS